MSDHTTQTVLFPALISKPIWAAFDQAHSSSDGGGLLLKGIDERLRLSEKLASCLRDGREPGKVRHEIQELFRQRMFAIALGHPDCNDARGLPTIRSTRYWWVEPPSREIRSPPSRRSLASRTPWDRASCTDSSRRLPRP